nr:zinc finger, CCHC-type [Tanacetum cinerariifolium]
MAIAAMKHMDSNFSKLDKFKRMWGMQPWKKSGRGPIRKMMTMFVEDSLEAKYMTEDASSKNFLEELTLIELVSNLPIEESLRVQGNDKPKGNNVTGPLVVNMMKHNNSFRKPGRLKKDCRGGKAANKANGSGTNGSVDGFTNSLKDQNMFNKSIQGCMAVVRLPDLKLKTLGERGIECIFVGYDEHFKAFTLYIIEPNDLVSVNSIIKTRDVIFNENRFSLVPRLSLEIPNRNDGIGGSMVPKEVTEVDDPKTFDEEMMLFSEKKQSTMRWIPSWATILGCWLIYLQVANHLVANESSKEN